MIQHPHVELRDGVAFVVGTRVHVIRLWRWHERGVKFGGLVSKFRTLREAQVLSALAWCYDNPDEVAKQRTLDPDG